MRDIGLALHIQPRDGLALAMKGDAITPDTGTENMGAWSTIITGIAITAAGITIAITRHTSHRDVARRN